MIRLGIAERQQEGVISVSTLADEERLPFKFLEAILFELRGAGYVGKHPRQIRRDTPGPTHEVNQNGRCGAPH